jgi:hypothetical protein
VKLSPLVSKLSVKSLLWLFPFNFSPKIHTQYPSISFLLIDLLTL